MRGESSAGVTGGSRLQPAFMLSAVLGPGLALLLLWLLIKRYEGAFDERQLFTALFIGMILGLAAFLFHGLLDPVIFPPSVLGYLVYVVGFAVLETTMMFVVLNTRWVRGEPRAAFTGAALGAGFSASGVMALSDGAAASAETLSPLGVLSLTCVGVASPLFRISAGVLLGIGSAISMPWQGAARAFLAQIPYGSIFMLLYYAGAYYEMWLWVPIAHLLVGYSAWLVRFIARVSLPEFLPGDVKRRLRRERRRPL